MRKTKINLDSKPRLNKTNRRKQSKDCIYWKTWKNAFQCAFLLKSRSHLLVITQIKNLFCNFVGNLSLAPPQNYKTWHAITFSLDKWIPVKVNYMTLPSKMPLTQFFQHYVYLHIVSASPYFSRHGAVLHHWSNATYPSSVPQRVVHSLLYSANTQNHRGQ